MSSEAANLHGQSQDEETSKVVPQAFGRYVLHAPIARGGMARVYTARLVGAEGFNRLVAAKRLHPQLTDDPDFVAMFHDEARIASKIHHPNVVPVLDVVVEGGEVILVQEYVHGVPLDKLFRAALMQPCEDAIPVSIAVAIIAGVFNGLHAAHETKDELDRPLDIVHRDVSPQNVMVSVDGIPRLLDFGIARAHSCAHVTREGVFKGKVSYMAPEQLRAEVVTRSADIYAMGVLLWELLSWRRMHGAQSEAKTFSAVLCGAIPSLTAALEDEREQMLAGRWEKLEKLEPIVARALATLPEQRFDTASQMLDALLEAHPAATTMEVAHWVRAIGAEFIDARQKVIASSEESWRSQSKIPAARASDAPSESGIVVGAHVDALRPPAALSSWPAQVAVSDLANELPSAPREGRPRTPWIIAAALLALSALLLGVVGAQSSSRAGAAGDSNARATEPPAALPTPIATAPFEAANTPLSQPTTSAPPPAEATTAAPARPVARWYGLPRPAAPATTTAATSQPAPSATQTSAPSAKPDCDPPFYFEGSKKLYKPGCI